MLTRIIYANFLPFIALIVLLFLLKQNPLLDKRQSRLFLFSLAINLAVLTAISADGLLEQMPHDSIAWLCRRITSFIHFAATPFIPLMLYQIFSKNRVRFSFYIPCLLNFSVCFLSMFTGIVFDISEQNTYERGILFLFPFACALVYTIILIIHMGAFGRKGNRSERIFLTFVILLLILCMYLEIAKRYRFLSWDAAAICLILYYLLININNAKFDTLTGAYNRAVYTKTLSTLPTSCSIALLDINNFKLVNDVYGHDAGDRHLIDFVYLLETSLGNSATLYRIGGDEFAVISKKWGAAELKTQLERIRTETNQKKIDFAYGTATYQNGYSIASVLQEADRSMYLHKTLTKQVK